MMIYDKAVEEALYIVMYLWSHFMSRVVEKCTLNVCCPLLRTDKRIIQDPQHLLKS